MVAAEWVEVWAETRSLHYLHSIPLMQRLQHHLASCLTCHLLKLKSLRQPKEASLEQLHKQGRMKPSISAMRMSLSHRQRRASGLPTSTLIPSIIRSKTWTSWEMSSLRHTKQPWRSVFRRMLSRRATRASSMTNAWTIITIAMRRRTIAGTKAKTKVSRSWLQAK